MKTRNNPILKKIKVMALIFALLLTTNIYAKEKDRLPDSEECGDAIPLDGGLSILLLGAAAFGVKKLRDSKNGNI